MVWKQDLAKLKQAYRESGGPPPPLPKPKPKPVEGKTMSEEDAMFLAAMGAPAPKPARAVPVDAPPVPVERPVPMEPSLSFEEGLADLKGLKPLPGRLVLDTPAPPIPVPPPAPSARAEREPAVPAAPVTAVSAAEEVPAEPLAPESARRPVRIHLAAGMAVEVDAVLDLRGHSLPDALGRLGDRIEDGAFLGWRTLHVILGEAPGLHEAMHAFLQESPAGRIRRYAQAPIPMGGAQAWVLYY